MRLFRGGGGREGEGGGKERGERAAVPCLSHRLLSHTVLQIPIELASNQAEVAAYREIEDKRQRLGDPTPADAPEPVVPLVPFSTCLERYFAAEPLESFRGQKNAIKTTRFATFPKMLVVHLRR